MPRSADLAPVAIRMNAPPATRRFASIVAKLIQQDIYRAMVLEGSIGAEMIEAAKRGRSLRELSRAVGLSPTYLSLVSTGRQRISVSAMHRLLGECDGVEKTDPPKIGRRK
jgi:hypothetical protein